LGQLYHRPGSKVTILEKKEQFLSLEDEDIASALRQVLEEKGITIHTGASAKSFKILPDGTLQAVVQISEKTTTISCTHLLVAVGQFPQSAGLNLDQTGITPGEKGLIPSMTGLRRQYLVFTPSET
jgi:pyruvate/2-oxoglutarate dehydrogenase complex dihydrolipoamide dehydrogenase (E3) component